ncbi:MAG TPA: hypothetical protein VFI30_05935 [Nocardioidaceae bacterium]|nr:hypothetical protein [Nocardioidaceae bacterium]
MPEPLSEVTRRLHHEFPAVPLGELIDLTRHCRAQIDTGAPEDCIPELVERLARVRLSERVDTTADGLAATE